ncbi:MAG: hypothetical protein MJB14_05990 [Spirochaetes bacterium]|nr:hypothetical protein [Spirochaetota bacterium]
MRKIIVIIIFILGSSSVYSLSEIEFIDQLSTKEYATFGDAVLAFCYLYQFEISDDFQHNVVLLKGKFRHWPKKGNIDQILTIGNFSLFAIQYLNIKSGIFYLMTKSGRYASRELVLLDIIPRNTSENEKVTGMELLRFIQKVSEYEKSL